MMGNSAMTPFSLWHGASQRLKWLPALTREAAKPLLTHLPSPPFVGLLGVAAAEVHLVLPAIVICHS